MERTKLESYLPVPGAFAAHVVPLVFESFGRWGALAEKELLMLAGRRAQLHGHRCALDPAQAFGSVLRRWRQRVGVALMRGNFEVIRAAVQCRAPPAWHVQHEDAALWLLCTG